MNYTNGHLSVHSRSYMAKPPCFCRKMQKNPVRFQNIITLRVFGVIRSYLVCIELIRDGLRKTKIFDEKTFFPMKNLKY